MNAHNPLKRTSRWVHIPLVLLGMVFLFPLVWLTASSLQSREQVGRIPPQWLPRMYYVSIEGEKIPVTPPEMFAEEQLLVTPLEGPDQGRRMLVPPSAYQDGMLAQRIQVADQFEDRLFPAELVQRVPAGYVYVREWLLSKYGTATPRQFYVPEDRITVEIQPIWGNFPEAIRALTAGEEAKKQPLGQLLGKTRWPWTPSDNVETQITFLTYLANSLVVAVLSHRHPAVQFTRSLWADAYPLEGP